MLTGPGLPALSTVDNRFLPYYNYRQAGNNFKYCHSCKVLSIKKVKGL